MHPRSALLRFAMILASASLLHSQPAPSTTSKVYLLLKPAVAEPGASRDAFVERMTNLGAQNLQFVTGANAARCDATLEAQQAIAKDTDVASVLPIDAPPAPQNAPPNSVNPTAPLSTPPASISTPPYIAPPAMPIGGPIPVGGGMSLGMAMVTDFAGSVVVKLLSPGASCKIKLDTKSSVLPTAGGTGAFEVNASGNCAWLAVSTADWLTVKSDVSASGKFTIVYTASANPGGHRQAVIVIQPVSGMPPLKGRTVLVVSE